MEGYLACMAALFACKPCGRDDGMKKFRCWLRKVMGNHQQVRTLLGVVVWASQVGLISVE